MIVVRFILLTLALLGSLYYVLSTYALARHFRRCRMAKRGRGFEGKISVLKPVCGVDANANRNFESFLGQDHRDHEVLFGVLEESDPAVPVIRQVISASDRASIYLGSKIPGANNKVRILDNLARHAAGEILVIADADTRVRPEFLARITAPFADESVGMVTCLYKGVTAKSIADAIEGLHMTCVFAPGVACAYALGVDFGLGAAIAIRRSVLEAIGGFAAIVDYLADDFQLGKRTREAGYKVLLSDYVIDIVLSGERLGDIIAREVRWARTTRISRPSGHVGLIVTYGFAYALAFAALTGFSVTGLSLLAGTALVRFATSGLGAACLGDAEYLRRLHLLPLRDLLSFAVWIASYLSNSVKWRGRRLRLLEDGRMAPMRNADCGTT